MPGGRSVILDRTAHKKKAKRGSIFTPHQLPAYPHRVLVQNEIDRGFRLSIRHLVIPQARLRAGFPLSPRQILYLRLLFPNRLLSLDEYVELIPQRLKHLRWYALAKNDVAILEKL